MQPGGGNQSITAIHSLFITIYYKDLQNHGDTLMDKLLQKPIVTQFQYVSSINLHKISWREPSIFFTSFMTLSDASLFFSSQLLVFITGI